jgi:hypothetical protein
MPGIWQSESFAVSLPIENSPPGIQTIPSGATDMGAEGPGMVGANPAPDDVSRGTSRSFAGDVGRDQRWATRARDKRTMTPPITFMIFIPFTFFLLPRVR